MKCTVAFLLFGFVLQLRAGTGSLFDTFTIEDGLSHNQVNALAQDNLGFLWIATPDGLTRYDGYTFVQYRHDFTDSLSLPANFVGALHVDDKGNLWVGTFNGLCRYDPSLNGFKRYSIDSAYLLGWSEHNVVAIFQDGDGVIWTATDKGILRLSSEAGVLTPLLKPDGKPYQIRPLVTCFAQDPWNAGKIWMGLQFGGIITYEKRRGALFRFSYSSADERLFSSTFITSILPDASVRDRRTLWVTTVDHGLFRLDLNGERGDSMYIRRVEQGGFPASLRTLSRTGNDGSIWGATAGGGIMELTVTQGEIKAGPAYQTEPPTNIATALYEDRSGNLWVGTYAGLNKLVRRRLEFTHLVPFKSSQHELGGSQGVTSLFEDSRGVVWVGTTSGDLMRFHPEKSGEDVFSRSHVNRMFRPRSAVTAIHETEEHPGILWIGTYANGLFRWNTNSGEVFHMLSNEAETSTLSSNLINCIAHDGQGKLWIGTDNGINILDPSTLELTRVLRNPSTRDSTSLLSNTIWTIVPDRQHLWVGTVGGWLSRFTPGADTFKHFHAETIPALNNRTVVSLHRDLSGTLWIGTYSGGLKRLSPDRSSISDYTIRDGLPNNMVVGILEDERGNLWLSTNNGLCLFDTVSGTVLTFDKHDGIQSNQFYRNVCLRDRSGALYFGGPNGITRFHPTRIVRNERVPRVLLTNVQVLGEGGNLAPYIAGSDSVELTHTKNSFLFEFLAIDLTNPKKNRYAYMLEGADKAWVESGARRNATYAGLPPGLYTFWLKASNNDGIWSKAGPALVIHIKPPYWQTWWFRSVSLMLLLGLAFGAYRVRVHSQVKRRLEIERVREEERESVRIRTARDFHDEMGHRLTRINMLSETAGRKLEQSPEEVKDLLDAIRENANHLFNGTRDFIWSLDARNDSLFDLAARLKDFGDELFYKTGIAFQAGGITEEFHSIRLPMEVRRQLMLIFKEAMTNSAQHARAARVEMGFAVKNGNLTVTLSDDGVGFDPANNGDGTGLSSMQARAGKVNGVLDIASNVGQGTCVTFRGSAPSG